MASNSTSSPTAREPSPCSPRRRAKGDLAAIGDVARRYSRSTAGSEAAGTLGAYHLDRGRPLLAALCFARLLDRADVDLAPAALLCAAQAFHRSGDAARAELAWKRLAAKSPAGLRLGNRLVSLDDLRNELGHSRPVAAAQVAPGPARVPGMTLRWSWPTVHEAVTRGWLATAVRQQEANGHPVVADFYPVTAGDRLFYRSFRGIHAVDLHTGKELWEKPALWSIDKMAAEARYSSHLESWVDTYMEGGSSHILFSNSVVGTLTTDGARVYAVDDLEVPPVRIFMRGGRRWQEPPWPDFGPELNDAAFHSRLLALDARTGAAAWSVGGRGMDEETDDLTDTFFLGPPLHLDGRLYAMTEQSNKLSLVCLRPDRRAALETAAGDRHHRAALRPRPPYPVRPAGLCGRHDDLPHQLRSSRGHRRADTRPRLGLSVSE